jgi:glycosyltransferase involved in cell wall biosynthesis
MTAPLNVQLITCGKWHLAQTALALHRRGSLAGLWLSEKDETNLPREKVHRSWPFHLAMKPFYHFASQIVIEQAFYAMLPVWKSWISTRDLGNPDVIHAIMGYAEEPFDYAEKIGALKVVDDPNSHPATYFAAWQRECDLWCPGEKVPVPPSMFARMKRDLERADMVIVQSQYCKETMIQNGIAADKVFINPMGVDTSVFQKRERVPDQIRFICVGTICLRKGHQYLFRAFELVKKELPDAELICRGDYKTDFRMERPKWEGTFTQVPPLPIEELAALLRGCTAFVFPSQEEGIARAQIEALASGLPVIGTHAGGATTLVRDGIEGFIVDGRDPASLSEAMLKAARDPELNRRMGEAAFLKGAVKNTWDDYGDRLLAEYRRRLAAR